MSNYFSVEYSYRNGYWRAYSSTFDLELVGPTPFDALANLVVAISKAHDSGEYYK